MEMHLVEEPETQEALEFLCLAEGGGEGGEATHYEVLTFVAKVKNRKFGTTVRTILGKDN